ncbi:MULTISPECIES: hypothetical protein [unclassified Acinetobacter]|jgi:hypothetical protein|uniref:hypothetical protein n=1 Tax=unclassified Acinetobacter TaxID=196816 RepID=UPI0022AC6ADC|nr:MULTISPECIES: hypothetical protein [unclassified Acinetobacter]WAU73597.1 hypothetical protein O1450_00180 [Acinetobacter sp. TR11]WAU76603.1 hypothetical protein O1449_15395 [Acinetobacter sp. TR3]
MGQDNVEQHRRYVAISYVFMFLALFTIVFAVFAYLLARKVAIVDNAEVWIHAHALWIMRNVLLFTMIICFAALWFIPLFFFAWDSALWVTGMTVAGVIFSAIAWLFLLNAWIKGVAKYFKNKAVF